MAIKRKVGGRITGLAADPKPTPAAEPLYTIFQETDTHNDYINNGTAWVLYRAASKTETLTNKTISGSSNTVSSIPVNSISSFAISTPLTDQLIQYNGTNWVNATVAAGGGGDVTATSTTTFTNKTIGDTLKYTKQGSTPADQANIEDIMLYSKAVDANNNGLFAKAKQGGVIVELRAF